MNFKFMFFLLITLFASCSKYKDVPASECERVTAHAQKILDGSKSRGEIMSDCKSASDQQRGCAMAAKNALTLAACTKK